LELNGLLPERLRFLDLSSLSDDALFTEAGERWRRLGAAQASLLEVLSEVDARGIWELDGAEYMEQWMGYTFGLSLYRSGRWLDAAEKLAGLPRLRQALEDGELSIFKVEELARFVTAEEEDALVRWVSGVPCGAIKEEADRRSKAQEVSASSDEDARYLRWRRSDDGGSLEMHAQLPAVEGEIVRMAIDDIADRLPGLTGGRNPMVTYTSRDELRADALVALASAAAGSRTGRAPRLLIHAPLATMIDLAAGQGATGAAWTESGSLVHPDALARLLCGSDLTTIIEDAAGAPIAEVRGPRAPSPKMVRQLRYRDRRCVFPNCSHSRYTDAHHIKWWSQGGKTELGNLVLLCDLHHKLVHEHGWSLERDAASGEVKWFRPDGTGYRAGPRAGPRAA
jgi:hypothetical protein